MISLDTHILLRYGLADHATLSPLAQQMVEGEDCHVSVVALAEAGYVLQSLYGASVAELLRWVRALLPVPTLHFEHEPRLAAALDGVQAGIDWFDAMLWLANPRASEIATFDRRFALRAQRASWQPPVRSHLP